MANAKGTATRSADRVALIALLDGRPVGRVHQSASGTLGFTYDDDWREHHDAYPLSLSLPLTARTHRHDAVAAFLWGLLPDSGRTLDHYARLFGVSAGNPVALLSHIGADCAGAVQFAAPDRVDALTGGAHGSRRVDWLTDADVATELRTVRDRGIAGATSRTAGQFSLAGAQPKIALLEENGRWGRPSGRTPTNRILKPPALDFPGFAENEHFCLDVMGQLGLGAVRSRVMRFEDKITIVIERFDRVRSNRRYRRVHQEDVCQALGIMPTRKYENEGGPGIADIVTLLRDSSRDPQEDIGRFIGAMAVNWILTATDAHAKNYALLHAPGGGTRLAPFYDVASYLPYADPTLFRVKLAMKIGSAYLVRRINRSSWETLARTARLATDLVVDTVNDIVRRMPNAVQRVEAAAIDEGLDEGVIGDLATRLRERLRWCTSAMREGSRA